MSIKGSCLCGSVKFEITKLVGPFEICHCTRCRKQSGSNGLAMVGAHSDDYRLLSGLSDIVSYEAPILNSPPAYHVHFCKICGSSAPPPNPSGWFEIQAGLLDDDPGLRPDKHIFVDLAATWDIQKDELPCFTVRQLVKQRGIAELPDEFEIVLHQGGLYKV